MTRQDGRNEGPFIKKSVSRVGGAWAVKFDLPQMAEGTHIFVVSGTVVPQVKADDQNILH